MSWPPLMPCDLAFQLAKSFEQNLHFVGVGSGLVQREADLNAHMVPVVEKRHEVRINQVSSQQLNRASNRHAFADRTRRQPGDETLIAPNLTSLARMLSRDPGNGVLIVCRSKPFRAVQRAGTVQTDIMISRSRHSEDPNVQRELSLVSRSPTR